MIFVGNDWAEDHHDVYVMDEAGKKLAAKRFSEGIQGLGALHALLGTHAEDPALVRIGIETDQGLWVNALVAAGYQVHAINPRAAARYRDRHHLSGAKSDSADAKMLADLVRTDAHNHRLVAGDSAQVEGIKVLARAHQNLIWSRARETNRLRNALREYYPAALVAFEDLDDRDALAVLGRAPDPATGARLSLSQIKAALRAGGRRRYLDATAQRIQEGLRTEQLAAPAQLAEAYTASTRALVGLLVAFNTQIRDLEAQLEQSLSSTRTPTSTSRCQA